MPPEWVRNVLVILKPLIEKKDTNLQKPIPAEERLALTLSFLATGDSQQSFLKGL